MIRNMLRRLFIRVRATCKSDNAGAFRETGFGTARKHARTSVVGICAMFSMWFDLICFQSGLVPFPVDPSTCAAPDAAMATAPATRARNDMLRHEAAEIQITTEPLKRTAR
jgi:hypothetical protein